MAAGGTEPALDSVSPMVAVTLIVIGLLVAVWASVGMVKSSRGPSPMPGLGADACVSRFASRLADQMPDGEGDPGWTVESVADQVGVSRAVGKLRPAVPPWESR